VALLIADDVGLARRSRPAWSSRRYCWAPPRSAGPGVSVAWSPGVPALMGPSTCHLPGHRTARDANHCKTDRPSELPSG
jgi:hypothetical protein